jgi:retron-type reverse transcriptase
VDSFYSLQRNAAAGVDGMTWRQYQEILNQRVPVLHRMIHAGAYRAKPSRRVMIPKADGRQRPLGIASIEDKVVQQAVVTVLNAIYEKDFLGFSYGFRQGRGQHNALDALTVGIKSQKVNWILDADIRSFFDEIDHGWMLRFLEHRIGDVKIPFTVKLSENLIQRLHQYAAATGLTLSEIVSRALITVLSRRGRGRG